MIKNERKKEHLNVSYLIRLLYVCFFVFMMFVRYLVSSCSLVLFLCFVTVCVLPLCALFFPYLCFSRPVFLSFGLSLFWLFFVCSFFICILRNSKNFKSFWVILLVSLYQIWVFDSTWTTT